MRARFLRGSAAAFAAGTVVLAGSGLAVASSPDVGVQWNAGKAFPLTATRFDGATVDGRTYFLGFRVDDSGTTDGSVWYYDIGAKKYVDTGVDMPVPISNYKIAVLQNREGVGLYTFGGRDSDGKILKTVQVYYPATNKAEVLRADPWPGTTPSKCVSLPGTGVRVFGDRAYVLGGMSFSTSVPPCIDDVSKQVWSFNPRANRGDRWTAQPGLHVGRGYIAGAIVGRTIYAIGGDTNEGGALVAQPTVEAWKIGTKMWGDKGVTDLSMPCDESQAFGFSTGPLADTITLAGCGQWPNALADVQQYDVSSNRWSNIGALNEARRNQAGANIGTAAKPQLMVVGGYNSDGSVILSTSEVGTPGSFAGVVQRTAPPSIGGLRQPSTF